MAKVDTNYVGCCWPKMDLPFLSRLNNEISTLYTTQLIRDKLYFIFAFWSRKLTFTVALLYIFTTS